MEEKNEVMVRNNLTALDIRKQVNLIKEVMNEVMQEGQHYGKIPGCGDKPSLLKPGAEKLSMVFKLRPIMSNNGDIIIEKSDNGHREVTVYCHILHQLGGELATGIGSCSTMESKFRYRGGEKIATGKPIPTEYWNLKKAGETKKAQELIGGSGFGAAKIDGSWQICKIGEKIENPDIADTYNTILKMAKKRAYVDGILSATAASDIFTQDIEDLPEGFVVNNTPIVHKAPVTMPKEKDEPKKQEAVEETFEETEVNEAINVLEALEKEVGDTFDVWGILFDYKSIVTKTKKDVTYYKISPRESTEIIEVANFGKPKQNIILGDPLKFIGVTVNEYKGEKKYLAKGIELLEKGSNEPTG